jgi:hypothetical protein
MPNYGGGNVAPTGRRLTIGDPDSPDIVLDASPGKFLPEREQIESFIDHLLCCAGRGLALSQGPTLIRFDPDVVREGLDATAAQSVAAELLSLPATH